MTNIERLIALDFLRKAVDAEIRRVRPEVEAHYHDRMTHEADDSGEPVRSFGYWLGGEKLASFYFPQTKSKPERRRRVVRCYDFDAVLDDDNDDFAEWLSKYIRGHIGELAERYVTETGDALAGVVVEDEVMPGEAPTVKPMQFRINEGRIRRLMRPQLPDLVAGLLEG